MTASDLHFIVSNGPKLQADPGVRTIIRKQAMKNVALIRKKRGSNRRVNVGQLPATEPVDIPIRAVVTLVEDGSPEVYQSIAFDNVTSPPRSTSARPVQSCPVKVVGPKEDSSLVVLSSSRGFNLESPLLLSEYETACTRFQVGVTDLSMLTHFHVGKATRSILVEHPDRLMSLLGHSQWSFLQFIPSYYGFSDCLTAATNCLLARVRGILVPRVRNRELELRFHTRALRCLQFALQDPVTCKDSDVLCTTQLLGLCELLDFSPDNAWNFHVEGSTRLVKHRTPDRFDSEFDKALFAAHVGPVVSEAIISHDRCYLEDPQWLDLYRSLAEPSSFLNDRSPLCISVRSQMFIVPGLWYDIGETVNSFQFFDDTALSALEARCRKIHAGLLDWMKDYKTHCMSMSLVSPPSQELDMRRELFGTALECIIVVKRLLATVCDNDREVLEPEVQELAQAIFDLQTKPSPRHSWLFSGQEVGVAHTIVATHEEWSGTSVYESEYKQKLAARSRFISWTNMIKPNTYVDDPSGCSIWQEDSASMSSALSYWLI